MPWVERGAFPCFGGLGDDGGSAPDKHPSNEQLPCLGIHLLPSHSPADLITFDQAPVIQEKILMVQAWI